jgi:hypothetical protein
MIKIYGKENCGICESAKEKMKNVFKKPFEFIDIEEPGPLWRTNGVLEALSMYEFERKLPIFDIYGILVYYVEGLKMLKALQLKGI